VKIRKANYPLCPLDRVDFYYDKDILSATADDPVLLRDTNDFSIWYKPANILSQGSKFGDHLSLLRFAEKNLKRNYPLHLVHRLDRETCGLIIIAHNSNSAAALSCQFAPPHHAQKKYWARVKGHLHLHKKSLEILAPLDEKPAVTIIEAAQYDHASDTTELLIELKTGRFHQIRKHLSGINHPVCGDYRYGRDRGDKAGLLQLCAWQLSFDRPGTAQRIVATLPEDLLPFSQALSLSSGVDI